MLDAFEQLCDILDDERVRQETLLSLLRAQREGAIRQDVPFMQAKTAAIEALIAETAAAEAERHRVLRILVDETGLPLERQTLSALIAFAPPRSAVRLREAQERLQSVMTEAKAVAQANGAAIRRAVAIVDSVLDVVDDRAPERGAYNPYGAEPVSARRGLVLDSRG